MNHLSLQCKTSSFVRNWKESFLSPKLLVIYLFSKFLSDVSKVKPPFIDHLQQWTLSFIPKLLELVVSFNFGLSIWVQGNTVTYLMHWLFWKFLLFCKGFNNAAFTPKSSDSHLILSQSSSFISANIISSSHSFTSS